MARDGAGNYTRTQGDYVFDTVIEEAEINSELNDIATALTGSMAADGQTPVTANLPMSTFKHTGVGNATARTDYAAAGQITDGALVYGGVAGGTANALTLTLSPPVTTLVTGMHILFKASANANTTAATVSINGLATIAVELNDAALVASDILANKWYLGIYDGTALQISKQSSGADYTDPLTTRGDVVVRGASTTDRLAVGTTGQVLTSDGTDPSWTSIVAANLATDAVETAKIKDKNVTVAKIADGTDGELITWGTDAVATTVAAGTSGHVLTSNGAGAAPTFQAASSSGLVFLEDQSFSSGSPSVIDFTTGFTDTQWDEIVIKFHSLDIDSSVILNGRVLIGGTPQSSAGDYAWGRTRKTDSGTTFTGEGSTSATLAELAITHTTAADQSMSGEIVISRPSNSTYFVQWHSKILNYVSAAINVNDAFGQYENVGVAEAIEGFRIFPSSGTMTGCTCASFGRNWIT